MKNYKNKYDELYKIDGINYSGISETIQNSNELTGKYFETLSYLKSLNSSENLLVLEVGASIGRASLFFPNYTGVEYSQRAVDIGKSIHGKSINLIQGDARQLPIIDSSYDFIFLINVLEHLPEPEYALDEMLRVAREEAFIYLDPAYNCRSFTIKKLEVRKFKDLSLLDKFEKLLIPLLDSLVFRAILSIPRRLYLESLYLFGMRNIGFVYKKLKPDFDLIQRHGHTSDDDAFSSFDKHSIIIYYLSRGYKVIGYESLIKRLTCRTGPVVVHLTNTAK
jgi:SAM-dependent methyltransferase